MYAVARSSIPQITERYFRFDDKWALIGADALGAMAYALDYDAPLFLPDDPIQIVDFIHQKTGRTGLYKVRPVPKGRGKIYVYRIITRLNDGGSSFREIADWMHNSGL